MHYLLGTFTTLLHAAIILPTSEAWLWTGRKIYEMRIYFQNVFEKVSCHVSDAKGKISAVF